MGLQAKGAKTITPTKHGAGKGFMMGPSSSQEKPPVLLHKDSKYVLERLTSIKTTKDYKDLGNHSTEAMGEMGLFAIAQVILVHRLPVRPFHFVFYLTLSSKFLSQSMIMMKGLMDRCLNRETALERV